MNSCRDFDAQLLLSMCGKLGATPLNFNAAGCFAAEEETKMAAQFKKNYTLKQALEEEPEGYME
ncbi:hypothetical protein NA8A_05223 [Nitratireductor indicus C115]|uniref:Uncharacterized protein n=1 Tax=Nitratireductor indicus C115 TaxID=1231190 RepID=K2P843_9HYPH|nr:hypothetical protein NA8A_05223 [Nitratireductor indicus C115]